jgi:hypothetical protein
LLLLPPCKVSCIFFFPAKQIVVLKGVWLVVVPAAAAVAASPAVVASSGHIGRKHSVAELDMI